MVSWTSSVALRSMATRPPDVQFTFRGATVSVSQEGLRDADDADDDAPPSACSSGEAARVAVDTTGRLVWPCSSLLLRWLEDDVRLARLCPHANAAVRPLRAIDVSSGAGLIACALAAAGFRVLATETAHQLVLLRANVAVAAAASGGAAADSAEYLWGGDPAVILNSWGGGVAGRGGGSADAPPPPPDFAVVSDVLYIALRDGLARELSHTLRALAGCVLGGVLFGYEERLWREEGEFMASLTAPLPPGGSEGDACGASALCVEELSGTEVELQRCDAVGGEEGGLADVFWQPPPFRVFILRRRAVES